MFKLLHLTGKRSVFVNIYARTSLTPGISNYCTKITINNEKDEKKTVTEKMSNVTWDTYKLETPGTEICIPEGEIEPPPVDITEKVCDQDEGGGSQSVPPRFSRCEPSEVIWAFVPREWYDFFVCKTGATGFYTFLFTVSTYLVSKEILVLEHNFYNGLSMALLTGICIKYIGPLMAKSLDKLIEDYEKAWEKKECDDIKGLEQNILDEEFSQFEADGQMMVLEAKRENVYFQLEDCFRLRQVEVHEQVLKRLNYQVDIASVHRKITQKNLVEWVQQEVIKQLSPELHAKILDKCITDILRDIDGNAKKSETS
ncbi:unnamed protein product [Brassicogethes aeneus]|uniref:ATP synthase subunit b n=1 Tax=Brassicogethes aeneus TaxID=1431903 RepID=A0A9P0AYD2_BRAAE|nr:unnamed protein product [Brassicogethes aeneus]